MRTPNLVKQSEKICMVNEIRWKLNIFTRTHLQHENGTSQSAAAMFCSNAISFHMRMSHTSKNESDNNRFVFVLFQNICVYPFWHFCEFSAWYFVCYVLFVQCFFFGCVFLSFFHLCLAHGFFFILWFCWNATDAACVYMCETSKLRDANNKYSSLLCTAKEKKNERCHDLKLVFASYHSSFSLVFFKHTHTHT